MGSKQVTRRYIIVLVAAGLTAAASGQPLDTLGRADGGLRFAEAQKHFKVSVLPSHSQVTGGQTFHLAVEMTIESGWVYYSPAPGPTVLPGSLAVAGGKLAAGTTLWPKDKPKAIDFGGETVANNVYEDRIVAYVPITVGRNLPPGRYPIIVIVSGQICDENVCVDLRVVGRTEVEVGPAPVAAPGWDERFAAGLDTAVTAETLRAEHQRVAATPRTFVGGAAEQWSVSTGLAVALLAGFILNVMPCVLPIIPIRILSIVDMAGQSRRRFVTLGLAFACGIVLFFVALAAANFLLRLVAARGLNWAEYFRYSGFRVGMAMVIIALAANLFGLFNVTVPSKLAGRAGPQRRHGHIAALSMGVMMAVLATPCTFATLIAALSWAQVKPLWLGTLVLVFIGVGMGAPHAVLAAFPSLLSKLPAPGRWMELFKQSMGFILLLVAVWLISTTSRQTYPMWVAGYGVVLAFCLWVGGTWVRYDAPRGKKLAVRGSTVLLAVAAGAWMLRAPQPPAVSFVPFGSDGQARIDTARQAGRTVLVEFTSATCMSCKWIEAFVYDAPDVAETLKARNVLAIQADVTDAGTPASTMLYDRLKATGPPLTVIYPPGDGQPLRLAGKFSKEDLIDALDAALGRR